MSGTGLLTSDYADPAASAAALGSASPLGAPPPDVLARLRAQQKSTPSAPAAPKNPETNLTMARQHREAGENPSRDPNAQNPFSSAGGNNQIIDGTWLDLMGKYHPEMVQGQSREQILAMKTNGKLNDEMAGKYDEENARFLASNGIAPTPNFINALYRAGPGDGLKLIQAARENPSAMVRDIAPALATPGNNGAGNLSVGQFLVNPYQRGPGAQPGDTPQQAFTIARGNQILSEMLSDQQAGKARLAKIDRDYKPVEVPQPPRPPETDPLKGFSSLAGVFAALASGFSRTPAIAAMNGLAGAMDAAKKSDWETYKANYDQFKTQSALALQAHEQHSGDVRDALEMMTKNMSAGSAMLNATMALSDDQEMRKHQQTGDFVAMGRLQDERDQRAKEWALGQPVYEATAQLTAAMHNYDAAQKGGDPNEVARAGELVQQAENRLAGVKRATTGGAGSSLSTPQMVTTPDGKVVPATFNKQTRQYEALDNGSPLTGAIPVDKKVNPNALLGPDELRPMVDAYIAGDKSQLANVGRGAQGAENITRFRKAWAEELKARGLTGQDQAAAFVRMASEMREAGAIGTRVGAIAVSGAEAKRVASLVTQAYDKLPREQFRPYNQLVAMVQNKTNSPEQAAARAADYAMVTAYARALNPSGIPRESDIQHGEALLAQSDSHESHAATINQMLLELDQIEAATGDARNQLIDRVRAARGFGSAPNASGQQGGRGANSLPPRDQLKVGQTYQTPRGPATWDGSHFNAVTP